jgi:hypothetical protein
MEPVVPRLSRSSVGAHGLRRRARSRLGSKNLLEAVHNYSFEVYHLGREVGPVRERSETTAALAAELGNPFRLAYAKVFFGWADTFAGDLAGGIAGMRQGFCRT